jgi:hypothetical protein
MTGKPELWKKPELPDWSLRQWINGTMNPAPLGDADRVRCVNSWPFQIYGICFLGLATSPINGGPFGAQLGNSHCKWNVPVRCAFPNVEKIAFYFGQYHWAKRKHNFYMKTACSIGKESLSITSVWDPYSAMDAEPPLFFIVHYLSRIIS